MGARMHGQEGALAPPPWKCCKVFCALVVTVKRAVDELFMHYFHNLSSAFRVFAPRPSQVLHPWTLLGIFMIFVPRPLICPPMKKILRPPMIIIVVVVVVVVIVIIILIQVTKPTYKTSRHRCRSVQIHASSAEVHSVSLWPWPWPLTSNLENLCITWWIFVQSFMQITKYKDTASRKNSC